MSSGADAGPILVTTVTTDLWPLVHAERAALADDLAALSEQQWQAGSLCTDWTVEETVAHLVAGASIGPWRWIRSVVGARGDVHRHNARRLAEHRGATPAETLTRFRAVVDSTVCPPGPKEMWLGEIVVHGADVRRPLGRVRDVPVSTSTLLAAFFATQNSTVRSRTVSTGLRLTATDGPFNAGPDDGPLVSGPTLALVMAMAGRTTFCDDLTGPGVDVLRSRC
ncbi:maleylpyruvate isomerase family mycothiol-dependent enzyme [Actinomycetospora soli]|uniref:maleylpyruvate isomerase family mycothiol-dependent enzyme n=1 Tax=Actinomycetospora soli TaxID=2893887 RepID=UPI001E420209|nr:maleylpyruvate isomerase family mycothiol-dependent enzyme [Actinomycetospora soli]MCD2189401.1 maleylpyruvate isomerase family mycothiol-dependent enzyme [Actinomycetospora soli]